MFLRSSAAILIAMFALALTTQAQRNVEAFAGGEIHLKSKIHRQWKIRLPAATTRDVGTALKFSAGLGADFKAALDGRSLKLDANGDGTLETVLNGSDGFVVLTSGTHRYGIRLTANPQWVFAPGSSMVGAIDGVRIQLIDQNLNGRFNDLGEDAMVIGRGKTASFLSKVVNLGDGRLETITVSADGATINHAPFIGPRGKVALSFATKGKVLGAVLQSTDGAYSAAVSKGQATLDLPAATYVLHSGKLSLGGNSVAIRTGRSLALAVKESATANLILESPVTAEFAFDRTGQEYNFSPEEIWFYGSAGEEYYDWAPLGKSPKISLSDPKTGREIAEAYFPGSC